MRYIKTYESIETSSDNKIFIIFLNSFITSLDYNMKSNHSSSNLEYDFYYYSSKSERSKKLSISTEIEGDDLFISIYNEMFNIIEEYLETIYGLNLITFESRTYNFEIKGNIYDVMSQITKEDFYLKRESNKFNI